MGSKQTGLDIIENAFRGVDLACVTQDEFIMKRCALNAYKASLNKKHSYLLQMFICKFKRANARYLAGEDKRKHKMSDHAFCRFLERVSGHSLNAMKDQALNVLSQQDDLIALRSRGVITTVLPRRHMERVIRRHPNLLNDSTLQGNHDDN